MLTGVYVVDQRQYAVLFAMGEVKEIVEEPGLYMKLPIPLQDVKYIDKRQHVSEPKEADTMTTSEKMNVQIDSFVTWRVVDPKLFYFNFATDDVRAGDNMLYFVKVALSEAVSTKTAFDLIAGDKTQMMDTITQQVAAQARPLGIEVLDVRIKRIGYIESINRSVYEKMKSERMRVAAENRSIGDAEAERIKAEADREKTIILAQAKRDAERIKGEGDAKAARIYASAFNKDPEFYRFYRSLKAYRESFKNKKDVLVIDPSSEFFKYMKDPAGAK